MSRFLSPEDQWKIVLKRSDYAIQAASIVILYYDYILTLPQEIQFMWRGARKTSTLLYIFCRYAMVANLMYLLYKTPGVTGLDCKSVNHTAGILAIFGHIGVLGVWGLRTVAIWNGNRFVPWILSSFALAIIALRIASQTMACTRAEFQATIGIMVAGFMMAFEALAFGLAAFRVWKTVRDDRKFWSNPQSSINYVIFSQGFMYIAAVFGLSIITAIFNLKIWGGIARPLNSFKLPLSTLLTARFLLRLRSWEQRSKESTDSDVSADICFGTNPGARTGATSGAYGNDTVISQMENQGRNKVHGIRGKVKQFGGNVGPALDPKDARLKTTVSLAPLDTIAEAKV